MTSGEATPAPTKPSLPIAKAVSLELADVSKILLLRHFFVIELFLANLDINLKKKIILHA